MYTRLKMSSRKVPVVVMNMSEFPVFLKKGVQVTRVVPTSPVPPAELSLEMVAVFGAEDRCPPLSVAVQQQKLATWDSTSSLVCPLGSATHLQPSNT